MYPPILVLVLAVVTLSKQTLSLETLLQLEPFDGDGDGGGGGGGGDFSSPTYEEAYDTDNEDVSSNGGGGSYLQQEPQPSITLDGVYYRVTPAGSSAEQGEGGEVLTSTSTTTNGNSILEVTSDEQLHPLHVASTDRSSGSSIEDDKVSVAQAFIGDDLHQEGSSRDALSSRSLDHDVPDTLQSSSTVLETSLITNHLYPATAAGGTYNDSSTSSTEAKISDDASDGSAEDDALSAITTTIIPLLSAPPDEASIAIIKPTKPHIDESKISKSELLSRMIADTNLRLPIAILVDTCNDSLSYSKKVFDASLVPKSPLEVILMRYNSTGIAKSTSFRNTKSLMDAINALQPSYESSGRAYYGILRTSQEIPYDSAIFLATSNTATDLELAKMAALTLLKKRIRLYVIWFGDEADDTLSEQRLDSQANLHELAFKTGGRVIRFEIDRHFGNNPVLTTLVSESDLRGDHTIPITVPEDVNSLYFKVHGSLDSATLRTPNGVLIDLLRNTVWQEPSPTDDNGTATRLWPPTPPPPLPVPKIIATNHTQPTVPGQRDYLFVVSRVDSSTGGLYQLDLSDSSKDNTPGGGATNDSSSSSSYSVTVKAETSMRHGIQLLELGDPALQRHYDEKYGISDVDLSLMVNDLGPVRSRSQKQTRHAAERQVLADGSTEESGSLGRAAVQAITKIDIGVNSQLSGTRGSSLQVIFEVTNFRQTPIVYYFRVTDELSFLQALNPQFATIAPDQTINVAVTLTIRTNAEIGARDKVTFSTEGTDQVSQAVFVTVTDGTGQTDSYQPSLWYTYSSRCEGRSSSGTCSGAFWTVEITARDYETGLLRIASNPRGIIYKAPFTAGTRDEVKASYTASCCQPRVTITATDVSKNARTVNLDVTDIWLNEAGIAAVVLGVLLLIALIVLLVILIRYCIRRKKRAQELPIYRSDARGTRSTR